MNPRRLAAMVGALAVTLAACGGNGDGSGDGSSASGGDGSGVQQGGTWTAIETQLDNTVPPNPFAPNGNSFASYNNMWLAWPKNHLTDPNDFYPGLAESWELSDDESELVVHLQPDAKWSDGEDVTAEDVELSVNIAYTRGTGAFVLSPGAAGAAREIEIIDDKTIKFTQDPEHPSNTFVRGIFDSMPIVPEHIYGELIPEGFDELLDTAQGEGADAEAAREEIAAISEDVTTFDPGEDVSAGPFVLERMNPGEALLVRNEHFYAAENVAPENVVLRNYSGNEQVWGYLQSGELDSAPFLAVPTDVMEQIENVPGNIVSRSYSPVVAGLAFNQSYEPYDDVRVRRALAYLIDREQVTRVASPEGGTPAATTSGIHQEAADAWLGEEASNLEPYDHDTEQARELLLEAGFTEEGGSWNTPDGEVWNVSIQVVSGFSDWISAGQNIVQQLEEFGVSAETVTSPDFTVYQEEMAAGEYAVGFWLIGLGPSSYNIFQRLYGQSNGWQVHAGTLSYAEPGTEGNWMGGPETLDVDDVGTINPGELTHELNTADEEREFELMGQLAKATNQELPVIQMWDYVNTRFFNDTRFEGFPDEDSDALRLNPGVWMAEGWISAK